MADEVGDSTIESLLVIHVDSWCRGYWRKGSDYAGNFSAYSGAIGCCVDVLAVLDGSLGGCMSHSGLLLCYLLGSLSSLGGNRSKISSGEGSDCDRTVSKASFAIPDHGPATITRPASSGRSFAAEHERSLAVGISTGGEEKRN
jgi:hypothetical protein